MTTHRRIHSIYAPALLLVALLVAFALQDHSPGSANQDASTIDLVALDADPEGNTATSVGVIETCAATDVGSEVTIDLVVDAIPADRPMVAFEMQILYDPELVRAVAMDNELLLAAEGDFQPFEAVPLLSDPLPDSDGALRISIVDLASNQTPGSNSETGGGVLSRITFEGLAEGISNLDFGFDPPEVYPTVIDIQNTPIGVGSMLGASVAVGRDCPPETRQPTTLPDIEDFITPVIATPRPAAEPHDGNPAAGDDDGWNLGLIALVAGFGTLGVLAVGGAGWALLRGLRSKP
jgi:hypothetical protein